MNCRKHQDFGIIVRSVMSQTPVLQAEIDTVPEKYLNLEAQGQSKNVYWSLGPRDTDKHFNPSDQDYEMAKCSLIHIVVRH